MSQTITAIFENGVLRPLTPLDLPERTQVPLTIEPSATDSSTAHRRQVEAALRAAGLIVAPTTAAQPLPLAEAERRALAERLAVPGAQPLSESIIAEREGC